MKENKVTVSSAVEVEKLGEISSLIRQCVEQILQQEQVPLPSLVEVTITDDQNINELNKEYRKIDRATDVLSFPLCEFYNGEPQEPLDEQVDLDAGLLPLGDIVLSMEHAAAQAKEFEHSIRRECGYLVIHSTLHLLGYDHERSEEEKNIMRQREEVALTALKLSRD